MFQPLQMTVYFESLCPYSQNFFINQLEPNFEKFNNYVDWVLIPYGNAKVRRFNQSNLRKCDIGRSRRSLTHFDIKTYPANYVKKRDKMGKIFIEGFVVEISSGYNESIPQN